MGSWINDALHPVVDGGGKAGGGRPPDEIAMRDDGAMQPLDDNDGGGMIKRDGRGGGEEGAMVECRPMCLLCGNKPRRSNGHQFLGLIFNNDN